MMKLYNGQMMSERENRLVIGDSSFVIGQEV